MHSEDKSHDAIIIGGGLSGLASAIYLARQGKSVLLAEQSRNLGGRARTKQQDGFYLNLGPHALYRGSAGRPILKELGVEVRGAVPPVSGGYAIKGGVKHTLPVGAVSLLTTSLFNLSAKVEAGRLLASLGKLDGQKWMARTVRQFVDSQISHPEVREFILAAIRVATYTNAPEQMSGGAAIEQLKKAFGESVLYLDGGWQTIVDTLEKEASRVGVVIEKGVKVEAIERTAQGAVGGVRTADRRRFDTEVAIIAGSPEVAYRLVERGSDSSLAKWASRAIPIKAACLDLALSRLPNPKATFGLGIDRPLYLSVHSATARLAPEGAALIHVAKYLAPGASESAESVERELEQLMDTVQPGWRASLVHRRFLPDLIVMNQMATAEMNGTEGRPGPEVCDVPGLFVAGDWVGKEGMLVDASLASAKRASELAASYRPLGLAVAG
jgi:phytoene dehydrogenase-like protein